ncbi:hypothetical protein HMPREF1987_01100 [Peptostreptococcaceae bacterium oral taxon 113 str. W5053]|nr:hypothetical protein HMPREF1987_01100 [Peptostreptococcaceae bacterium oral taxon 113 str. W5053]
MEVLMYNEDEKLQAKRVAEDLTTMNDKELNNLYWLMQGMKIARGCRE